MDQSPPKSLNKTADVLPSPLAKMINLLIKLFKFPECKITKLKSLFNKGSKTDSKNYSPISLLPVVSKIIEKSTHQFKDYLEKNGLRYKYQSGFRANF